MIDVKKIVAKSKKYIYGDLLGEHNSKIIGDGYDFAKIRPYEFGEHIRRIDPIATAKMGEIYLRTFYESKEINVEVIALMSGSLYFGSRILKKDALASIARDIGINCVKNSDRFGISLFSNKLENRIEPTKKEAGVLNGIKKIIEFDVLKKDIDYDKLLNYLLYGIKKRSFIFILGDFYDIPNLKAAAKKHEIVAVKIRDRFELNPKAIGEIGVVDPTSLKKSSLYFSNTNLKHYKKSLLKHDLRLKEYLKECSIRLIEWKI
ncbi:DUF58 domain-containing protein [Sulfurospirillum sp. 1307]|jgi:uncharacterized protein (DUF58 family)